MSRATVVRFVGVTGALLLLIFFFFACSSASEDACGGCPVDFSCVNGICLANDMGGAGGTGAGGGNGGDLFSVPELVSIEVDPANAMLVSDNGSQPTQPFTAIGTYDDGTVAPVDAQWALDVRAIGEVTETGGLFTANGIVGGSATVTATVGAFTADAEVSVSLSYELFENGALPTSPALFGNTIVDAGRAAQLVYPLHEAVMPQNVFPADIQWTNGASGDVFQIRIDKPNVSIRAYVLHSGAGFNNDWLVNTAAWRSVAQTDPDELATFAVDRYESASSEAIAADNEVGVRFAQAALTGSVYYWDIDAVRIQRIDDGVGVATSFMPTPPQSIGGQNCVGCHSVSNDGRYMAGRLGPGENIGSVVDLTVDLSGDPPPTVYPLDNTSLAVSSARWWFSTWSPDDTRMAVSIDEGATRGMAILDPFTGAQVTVTGTLPTNITHPAWSPNGLAIAYAANVDAWGGNLTDSDIGVLTVVGVDDFGATTILHDGTSLPGGTTDSYPTWTPDSARIAFAHGTGSRSDVGSNHQSALYIMDASGTNVVRLDKACGGATATDNFQPKFSPFDSGGYYWVSYLSRRDYGNALAGTEGTLRQQIWVSAIKKNPLPGEDPSEVGYWLPGQATTSKNISAFWAPRPCRGDGDECNVSSECCSSHCAPDGDGMLVCSPPPPGECQELNETCSSSAQCCDDLECVNNVCINSIPN